MTLDVGHPVAMQQAFCLNSTVGSKEATTGEVRFIKEFAAAQETGYVLTRTAPDVPVVHPDALRAGMVIVIAASDANQNGSPVKRKLMGPYMFLDRLGSLPKGLPTGGHAQLGVLSMKNGWAVRRVIAPKDGHNLIFGLWYSMHLGSRENIELLRS